MARIVQRATVDIEAVFSVTEAEARALDALVGYGDDAFIKHFKESLGEAYMRDHEDGLRSFFRSVRDFMPGILKRADDARRAFEGQDR